MAACDSARVDISPRAGRGFASRGLYVRGMLLRPRDLEATPEDPFANDTLGRQEHVKAVCRAIAEMDGPAVVALDGGWGTGKTAFLAMCTAWLQSEFELPVVGFNAWSQSHTQMPLVDLVSVLAVQHKPGASTLKKRVAAVGWHLAKFGTRGLVDRDVIAEATVSEDSWDNAEKETAEFKTQLQDWAETGSPRGLVVCVDELDRCRPEYALSLLEVIRHLFDVPGVVVLLAINRSELSHSVKSIFGSDFSADKYLRRIVDRTVKLPVPQYLHRQEFMARLLRDVGLAGHLSGSIGAGTQQMLLTVASPPGSLRDLQQAAVLAAMSAASMRDPQGRLDPASARSLIALVVLRIHAPDVYEALTAGKIGAIEAAAELSKAWPSAPSAARGFDAGQLDDTKRLVEAQLVIMEADSTRRNRTVEDFMPRYMAAGGDETTGTYVQAQIERWSKDSFTRADSIAMIADRIELFAQ